MTSLCKNARTKSHSFSILRSGIFIGTAIPALLSGIYYSTLSETHAQIRAWDALLLIYCIFFVPVIFSMLVGLNMVVWAYSRVDYGSIFGLKPQTRIDYQEYFEVPNLMFSTLCYAFWLSFSRIGSPHISPTIFPLVWLALIVVILFDPLPVLFRSSRFWLLRTTGRLFLPGFRRVEFVDSWMGDQFCSLVFTFSNLYTLVYIYVQGFKDDWRTLQNQSSYWPVAFVLAALPSLIRLVQCVRCYADSGLITHMINGGKYATGIINFFLYYLWRHQETHYNGWFVLWLIFATIYSTYATCWDIFMDWSLLQSHAKHFLLRDNLGYLNHIYLYYFAIVTNCLIRFAWTIYIPEQGPNMLIRTFVVALLEILRRVQWNFYRLENEHLRNMDRLRIAKEVPLPYALDNGHHENSDCDLATTSSSSPDLTLVEAPEGEKNWV